MRRLAFALLPLLALAACGGDEGAGNGTSSSAAAPVAAATPPAGTNWVDTVQKTPEGGYRMGNPNAPIKIVEYGSRTCPHCAEFAENAMEPLKQQYISTGKVSLEFRDFLLNGIDIGAALLGRCGGESTFFPMLEQMYANQRQMLDRLQAMPESFGQSLQSLPPAQQASRLAEAAGYLDFVKQRGIPEAKARACLADTAALQALVDATENAVQEKKVSGTPTFFINGELAEGVGSWPQLQTRLRNLGA